MSKYSKAIAALASACAVVASFLADGEVSQNDVIGIVGALAGVVGVYLATNRTSPEGT